MATTKAKESREYSADELQVRLRDLKQESLNLRLQRATGTLENPARIRQVRRETARVLTALTAKKSA
ncbi:MAG: 50S ribosomal protein L29 [Akkermansiaceae bacterium]|jgi:large subunit ribosomal protein L29|nr:50S ribosomal protein L29 [Akkermansiaceae bacterium]MBJ7285318.1 50S ribosomal protein L29 [Akkermansiaceae bacterium]MBJ7394985.1 50S ribosomal protein L29 [Akkermansiaceae bacterium]MBJ7423363.1 50S ribosomal protein L29 [Akkermansiaceae bacterium]